MSEFGLNALKRNKPKMLYLQVIYISFCISERGLIFTVFGAAGTRYAHLRHLPVMPYYENYSGAVPGISFAIPYMHFQSVDVDYRKKKIFLYDSYYRLVDAGVPIV